MDQLQELKEEVDHVGRLIEAGHRGIPIGGELLIAFGATLGLLGSLNAATAFGFLPLDWTLSPLAAAAAFLSFALLFEGTRKRLPTTLLVMAAATVAAELVWRGALAVLRTNEPDTMGFAATGFLVVPLLMIAVGGIVGLWRLKCSAAAFAPANRSVIDAWLGLAAAMAATIALCAIVGVRAGNWFGFMLLPGFFWVLWGAGWWTSATVTGSPWMRVVAAGSWVVTLWYATTFSFYSTSIVGLAALALAPGIQLLREARTTHEA